MEIGAAMTRQIGTLNQQQLGSDPTGSP